MKCPYCNYEATRVVDSRETDEGRSIRRRRECQNCGARFSTYEQIEFLNLVVCKKNGKREEYDKDKLEKSIQVAANKRIEDDEIVHLVADIEREIRARGKSEVETKDVGEIVLKKLKDRDEVSYLRFASLLYQKDRQNNCSSSCRVCNR